MKQSSEPICSNALISACQLSGTVTQREEGSWDLLTQCSENQTKPKEPGNNLFVVFPQVIPRSLVHGQADHCERQSKTAAFLSDFSLLIGFAVFCLQHAWNNLKKKLKWNWDLFLSYQILMIWVSIGQAGPQYVTFNICITPLRMTLNSQWQVTT